MGEQRFKVGDWVRRVEPSDWPEQYGVVDCIYRVLKVGRYGIEVTAGAGNADATSFEPWQPRVGERVRFTDKVPSFWFFGPAKEHKDGVIKSLNSEGYRFCVKTGDAIGHVNIEHIEPIITAATPEEPATLKIEAGKFYKTRDGRKVGPMTYAGGNIYAADGKQWRRDGYYWNGVGGHEQNDLIAEWTDEPPAKPSNDNAQPKFKVGERVKCLKSYPWQFTAGKEYVVSADHFGRKYESVKVKFDDAESTENGWLPEFFELVTPTTTIVALIENGQPKPSSTPHVHASTGAADKEAKRLAAKYKGKQFGVFTLTTTHEEAAPVYDHKWQNMAALGLKIDAIKELRAVAGIDLLSAKRAVEAFEQAA